MKNYKNCKKLVVVVVVKIHQKEIIIEINLNDAAIIINKIQYLKNWLLQMILKKKIIKFWK